MSEKEQIEATDQQEIIGIYDDKFWDSYKINAIWEDDELERKKAAKTLTKVISQFKGFEETKSTTVVVKSPWGTGKTFFVDKWQKTLQHAGFFTVNFSAWEAELHDSPTKYFIERFFEEFASREVLNSLPAEVLKNCITKLGRYFLYLIKAINLEDFLAKPNLTDLALCWVPYFGNYFKVKVLLSSFLPPKTMENLKNAFCERGLLTIGGWEKLNSPPENLIEAKKTLKSGIDEIINPSKLEKKPFKDKIYIFIDELDRCRPDFAITLLETLKHFFSVKGIVFVLTVDLEQLEGSIKHVYGKHIDCEGYLMRFVNLFFNLPKPEIKNYAKHLDSKIQKLPHILNNFPGKGQETNHLNFKSSSFIDIFTNLSNVFEASLRDQQRIFTRLYLMAIVEKVLIIPTVYLLFFQLKFPTVWQKLEEAAYKKLRPLNIVNFLNGFYNQNKFNAFNLNISAINPDHQTLLNVIIPALTFSENTIPAKLAKLESENSHHINSCTKAYLTFIMNNGKILAKQLDLINLYSSNVGYNTIGSPPKTIGQGEIQSSE